MIEVCPGRRLCLLASCRNPENIHTKIFSGEPWPVPRAGQMWTEYALLTNPDHHGVFWTATNPNHEPIFEFAIQGDVLELKRFEIDLLREFGFDPKTFKEAVYDGIAGFFSVPVIDPRIEACVCEEMSCNALFITHFPARTNPHWNTKRFKLAGSNTRFAEEISVIVNGGPVISSAEYSCDKEQMSSDFMRKDKDGKRFVDPLFTIFGQNRVIPELARYLRFKLFPRSGGSIDLKRLTSAVETADLSSRQKISATKPAEPGAVPVNM